VLLKALRQPEAGGPSMLARVVAVLLVVGLVASVSPALLQAARWLVVTFARTAL